MIKFYSWNIQKGRKTMEKKSFLVTELLCLFLGGFGVHRFYTGYTGLGIAQLLTLGGCGIWTLIDFIMISLGQFKDAQGQELEGYSKKVGVGILIGVVVLTILYWIFCGVLGALVTLGGAS